MKENKYDQPEFFRKYRAMPRSIQGLGAAGEWPALQKLLPDLCGLRVLDLGCGFGWHCRYAAEHGAASVLGVDISERMLAEARALTANANVQYRHSSLEDFTYPARTFDLVLSSLALHYIADFDELCVRVRQSLVPDGWFVFSVEHPVFTAAGPQQWCMGRGGERRHWPVDRYFEEGERRAIFLDETVVKYHRSLTGYVSALRSAGFNLDSLVEPQPDPALLESMPDMRDELRRPMMLLIRARA